MIFDFVNDADLKELIDSVQKTFARAALKKTIVKIFKGGPSKRGQ